LEEKKKEGNIKRRDRDEKDVVTPKTFLNNIGNDKKLEREGAGLNLYEVALGRSWAKEGNPTAKKIRKNVAQV